MGAGIRWAFHSNLGSATTMSISKKCSRKRVVVATAIAAFENTKRDGHYRQSNSLTVHHGSNYCANTSLF